MTIPGRARLVGSEGTEYAMDLGPALVAALADKDWKKKVRAILHPDLQLRGLTPGKFNEATGPNAVADAVGIFELWFYEDTDYLVEVLTCDVSPNGPDGQYKLSYSFRARSEGMSTWHNGQGGDPVPPDADWVVEQEAYFRVRDDRISWMIILCDGYHRPMVPAYLTDPRRS